MKYNSRFLITSALCAALFACGGDDAAESPEAAMETAKKAVEQKKGPAETLNAAFDALESNDLNTFLALMAPEDAVEKMRKDFKEEQDPSEITDEARAEFNDTVAKLTGPDAEEKLMAELEPQLAEMGPQLPMMMGFGQMMVQSGIQENADLDDARKQQAMDASNAVFQKLQGINLTDRELAKQAIGVVTGTARKLDLTTLDAVYEMSFDDMLYKGGIVLGGTKELLNVYGLDLNGVISSMNAKVVDESGDNATVEISYDLFGTPQTTTAELVKKDDRWFSADMIEQIENAASMDDGMADDEMAMPEG